MYSMSNTASINTLRLSSPLLPKRRKSRSRIVCGSQLHCGLHARDVCDDANRPSPDLRHLYTHTPGSAGGDLVDGRFALPIQSIERSVHAPTAVFRVFTAPSFNGRTADSGSAYRGSNPWGAAKSCTFHGFLGPSCTLFEPSIVNKIIGL